MITRMKKLISISTIPVLALVLLLVLGTVVADNPARPAKKPAPSLRCTITYDFVGDEGIFDTEGRLLAWDGVILGDIEGVILWWFDLTLKWESGKVSHYVARWEIWNATETELLLAGDSAGTTAKPPGKDDAIWRGNGIVTEAYGEFEDWIDRPTYEGGSVTWEIPGVLPLDGEGIFRIN